MADPEQIALKWEFKFVRKYLPATQPCDVTAVYGGDYSNSDDDVWKREFDAYTEEQQSRNKTWALLVFKAKICKRGHNQVFKALVEYNNPTEDEQAQLLKWNRSVISNHEYMQLRVCRDFEHIRVYEGIEDFDEIDFSGYDKVVCCTW